MDNYKNIALALSGFYRSSGIENAPDFHVVLGSGFSKAFRAQLPKLKGWSVLGEKRFNEIAAINSATAPGHDGAFSLVEHKKSNKRVLFQLGRLHGYEGNDPKTVVGPVLGSRLTGVSKFILTNAAGSLTKKIKVGSVMMLTDHVNLTGQNPLIGENPTDIQNRPLGPRFPDLRNTYSPMLKKQITPFLKKAKIRVVEGVYLGLLGPNYETPAEIRTFAKWGLTAVGMSTVWEAISLSHSGAEIIGMSLITNLGCGLSPKPLTHEEVLETAEKSATKIVQGILTYIETVK